MQYRPPYKSIFSEFTNTNNFMLFKKGLIQYLNSSMDEAYATLIDNTKRKTINQGMTVIKILSDRIEMTGSINGKITSNNFLEVDYESGQAIIELKGDKTLVIE